MLGRGVAGWAQPFLCLLEGVGEEVLAVAVAISGGVFVAMGFVSDVAETALIGVADANQPAAVLALDQLQGRTPVVWAITALVAALSLAGWRTGLVGRCFEQWHYAFRNTFTEERSRQLYERYHIPASLRVLWASALATLEPGHQDTYVNYDNDQRAPLLFISGTHDHLMPSSVQRSNAKHYKSKTVTEVKEFEGPHLLPSRDGWEEVADYALEWAVSHARPGNPPASPKHRRMTTRITHISGPTARPRWASALGAAGGDQLILQAVEATAPAADQRR